jgi:predicted nucleotidyltransferase
MTTSSIREAEERASNAIRNIAECSLPHASLVLFGSRARGDARRRSDFDLAVVPRKGFSDKELAVFSDLLDQSSEIIYPIDIVDMRQASEELKAKVEAEGRTWKN